MVKGTVEIERLGRRLVLGLLFVLFAASASSAATFVVTKEEDDVGPCEPEDCALREAILAARSLVRAVRAREPWSED